MIKLLKNSIQIISISFLLLISANSYCQVAESTLSETKYFNRGSRNFTLVQGTASSGWKHIYDRHINLSRFSSKSKFNKNLTQNEIINGLSKTLKHGSESSFEGLPVFEYRQKIKYSYKYYRATVNKDGTVRTFHPLD